MPNENEFTPLQDGKDCLPEQIYGVKNNKQNNIIDIWKSRNHKWNHKITKWNHEITDFEILYSKSGGPPALGTLEETVLNGYLRSYMQPLWHNNKLS